MKKISEQIVLSSVNFYNNHLYRGDDYLNSEIYQVNLEDENEILENKRNKEEIDSFVEYLPSIDASGRLKTAIRLESDDLISHVVFTDLNHSSLAETKPYYVLGHKYIGLEMALLLHRVPEVGNTSCVTDLREIRVGQKYNRQFLYLTSTTPRITMDHELDLYSSPEEEGNDMKTNTLKLILSGLKEAVFKDKSKVEHYPILDSISARAIESYKVLDHISLLSSLFEVEYVAQSLGTEIDQSRRLLAA